MAVHSKFVYPTGGQKVAFAAVLASLVWFTYRSRRLTRKSREQVLQYAGNQSHSKDKAAVDMRFMKQLSRILKIIVPKWLSMEMFYIVLVAVSLGARTYCDVWMIENGTSIESSIISRNQDMFKYHLFRLLYAMPVISVVNNLLKYGLNELKLRFRTRLSLFAFRQYLQGFTYYKMSNLDNRIANPDQLLTQDVDKLCVSIAELYSNLSKPVLDIVIYATRLTAAIGIQGPFWMLMYLAVSGLILTRLRRPVGRMTVDEQKLEGEFRFVNSRLITNSEEIAFYQGNVKEREVILSVFRKLIDHLRHIILFRFSMGFIDNIIAKYLATVCGFYVISRPFLDKNNSTVKNMSHSALLEEYYQSGRMLVRMAEAIGRVVLAGREMSRLAGFTSRVTGLLEVLDDLNGDKYQRTMVASSGSRSKARSDLKPGSGRLITQDHIIKFDKVPLVTPNGDTLVEELSFEVHSGVNVLVCGPNGCGKSSLFRILGQLWPLFGGTLTKPASKELFYVPQRPYMTLGTLREQIIYPHNHDQQLKLGVSDEHLEEILNLVQLSYLLEREGGFNVIQDWMDLLSGGEKQRIAMARIFYHKPQFAILDECTSAVSMDVEDAIYQHCRKIGITLFTVSHRKSLWKHHEKYLHLDGRGKYVFEPITSDTSVFGS